MNMRKLIDIVDETIVDSSDDEYEDLMNQNYGQKSPQVVQMAASSKQMINMMFPDAVMKTMKSESGNFIVQWFEDDEAILLIGIQSSGGKLSKSDMPDILEFIDLLISKMKSGKTLYTTPHKNSMKMLDNIQRRVIKKGLNFKVNKGATMDFGDSPDLQFTQVEATIE